ncbi:hypothetical protein [Pseudomonas sp. NPDC087336]|uniref:hypothetical protein n=1 Tax=Pseudomonas sp. NPDC087336 TaxID=3364436 RepID=UPI00380C8978
MEIQRRLSQPGDAQHVQRFSGSALVAALCMLGTAYACGTMNFCGNMAGVIVPILIGLIVQFTGSYFLVLIFFVVMAMLLAIFSSLIDYRERGLV